MTRDLAWTGSSPFGPPVRRAGSAAAAHPRGAMRLTRRGRLLVLALLVGLLLAAFTLGRTGSSQAATEAPTRTTYAQTTVHPGETLWAVAKRVAPGHDPRGLVRQIRELNHLDTAVVQSGQLLLIPRS